jgi:hypothetical protein
VDNALDTGGVFNPAVHQGVDKFSKDVSREHWLDKPHCTSPSGLAKTQPWRKTGCLQLATQPGCSNVFVLWVSPMAEPQRHFCGGELDAGMSHEKAGKLRGPYESRSVFKGAELSCSRIIERIHYRNHQAVVYVGWMLSEK